MSRKHILQIPTDVAKVELVRQKTRTLPLMPEPEQNLAPAEPTKAENKIVKQVGASWEEERARQARADDIERRLSEGQAVIEIETDVIDPSFVQDRMEGDVDGLVASIKEQGQQVPILVRPHPDVPGRYQIAFGHRRLRALKQLGRSAKAVVRALSDEQLVIAQGQENNERHDLSFIEKARFAARLRDRFSRDVIISSMSIDKGNLSKMLSVVDSLPPELIDAIGPAAGVGLPSWQQMIQFIDKRSADELLAYAQSGDVQAMPSPERFKAILALKPRRLERGAASVLSSPDGARLAQVKQGKSKIEITIDRKASPEFAAFILERVPGLFAEHQADMWKKKGS